MGNPNVVNIVWKVTSWGMKSMSMVTDIVTQLNVQCALRGGDRIVVWCLFDALYHRFLLTKMCCSV